MTSVQFHFLKIYYSFPIPLPVLIYVYIKFLSFSCCYFLLYSFHLFPLQRQTITIIVKSVVFDWTARHCSSQRSYMFCCIRYCWPISKLFPMPWFSVKRNTYMTGLSRYNQLMNFSPLNRRPSFRNLLISLKVNKQKKKTPSWRLRADFDVTSVFHFLKIYYSFLTPPPHLPWFLFILLLSFLFLSSFSSPEANDYDEEDETGNPLLEIKGNGRLIRDGACAINLCLDRHLRFR